MIAGYGCCHLARAHVPTRFLVHFAVPRVPNSQSMDLIADFNAMQRAINLRRDRTSRFQSKAVAGDADDYAGAGAGGGAGSGDGDGAGGADGDSGAAPAPRKINMREKLRARKKKRFSSDAGGIEGDDEDGGEAGQPADS